MSFLSGLKKVGSWITGSSFSANLAKTAIIGYTIYRLNRNLNKQNNPDAAIDEGVRLQINPSAENKIPVVYGAAFLSGIITDAEMSNANKTMHFCLTISEKTGTVFSTNQPSTTTFRDVYWNDQRIIFKADGVTVDYTQDRSGIIDRSLEGRVRVYCYDGGSNQPRAVQGFGSSGLTNAANLIPSWGIGTHQMNNLVFAVVRVDYDRDRGVTGLGNVKFHIENSMTRPGDCLFDYFTNAIYGAGVPSGEIDTATLTALNTYSDQSVVYNDQTLGPNQVLAARYRINGVVDTEKAVLENIEALASSAASWVSYDVQKGQWGLVINRAESPIVAFDDSTIIGSISINGTGIDDLYNRVKAEFPNRDIRDAADFVTIALPSNERNANEYENTLNIAYELINEPVQAEILSFIELKQSRVDLIIRFTTDYSYTILTAGDVVSVTNSRIGWTNKAFRVVAVNEKQDESGQLLVDITALEYDANVYSVADLFRFTRSDQNGIITIGSIGVPGTPVVTKIEADSRPRIIATSTSPTGIVERLEYWRTTDVSLPEAQRNYTLIGSVAPVGGGTFGIGQTVTFEYDSQGAGNFLIKTRGLNSITTGPYSEPSGIIEFQPQQVPDQIGPNTQLSGLIGALGALELLNLLDKLFKNDAGQGGLFDKIFSIFKDETGVDILGDAKEGDLVVAAELGVKSDGEELTTAVSSLDFKGAIEATGSSDVEVKLIDGANNKDILAWNAAAGEWQLISGCITCDFPVIPPPPTPATPCSLTIATTLPASNHTLGSLCQTDSTVPYTGSYFIRFNIDPGTNVGGSPKPLIPFYAPLQKGVGNVYLYGTDGVLEQTLTESQILIDNNVVELPFAPRSPGKDYYILIDDGLVTSCSCENAAIDSADTWTFRTSLAPQQAYGRPTVGAITPVTPEQQTFSNQLRVTSASPVGSDQCLGGLNLSLSFSENIKAGSGSVTVKERLSGSVVGTYAIGSASITENVADWGAISGLSPNTDYDITVPAGLVITDRQAGSIFVCDITVPVPAGPDIASEAGQFGFTTVTPLQVTTFNTCLVSNGTAVNSNIQIVFNKNIAVNNSAPAFLTIFSADGAQHQKIDLRGTFDSLKYGSIYGVSTSTITINPTQPFKASTEYYVNIAPGAINDPSCNQPFAGITDTSTIRFKTAGIATTPPPGLTLSSVFFDFDLDRPVRPGPGKMIFRKPDGGLLTTISMSDIAVQVRDNRSFVPERWTGWVRVRGSINNNFAATSSMQAKLNRRQIANADLGAEFNLNAIMFAVRAEAAITSIVAVDVDGGMTHNSKTAMFSAASINTTSTVEKNANAAATGRFALRLIER